MVKKMFEKNVDAEQTTAQEIAAQAVAIIANSSAAEIKATEIGYLQAIAESNARIETLLSENLQYLIEKRGGRK